MDVRTDAKRRVDRTARAMGASAETRRVLRAMVIRESQGDPCAIHTFGEREHGIGILGLSVRWMLPTWDRWASPAALHSPEVSAIIAVRTFRRAVRRHNASSWLEVNSVFATGRVQERTRLDTKFCELVAAHDVDCTESPSGKLGTVLGLSPSRDQYAFLERLDP